MYHRRKRIGSMKLFRRTFHDSSAHVSIFAMVLLYIAPSPRPVTAADPIEVSHVTISLVREQNLPARDGGALARLNFKEGQSVKEGDVVALLENEKQTLDLKAANLNLQVATLKSEDTLSVQTATAQLQEATSGRKARSVTLEIAQAEAESDVAIQVAAAEARLKQLELERALKSRESFKGSISEAALDRLKTALEKSELEVAPARDERRIRQLKPRADQAAIDQVDDQIARYHALVKQEEKALVVAGVTQQLHNNEVALAELRLEQRNVRAAFDGIIAKVEQRTGEWVEPGATVVRMIDLKTLRAEGFLPADQVFQDLVGRPVRIQLDAGSSKAISGVVTFVSSEVDPVNKQVRFWAEFDNSAMTARPGMSGALMIGE